MVLIAYHILNYIIKPHGKLHFHFSDYGSAVFICINRISESFLFRPGLYGSYGSSFSVIGWLLKLNYNS